MYGYSISKKGFLTNNYYKKLGFYEEPESLGTYVMVRLDGNEIIINQDFFGSFGLYIYEIKNDQYFAISNSFLLLKEYLSEKKKISFNKDFADNFIISWLITSSIHETMIKEITRLPSNAIIIINKSNKSLKIKYKDYKENSIPLESEDGLKLIDEWVDKWTYIIRSLKNITNNFYFDLTGGFDSRLVLSIILNSGIDINNLSFNSLKVNAHGIDEDLKIASNISNIFGFKLNNLTLDKNYTKWNPKEILYCSMYSKLGFHKEFYLQNRFFNKQRIAFTGGGGEFLRGKPGYPISQYCEKLSDVGIGIIDHKKEFYYSSMRLCQRSVAQLRKEKIFNNSYEMSSEYYFRTHPYHFGKKAVEGFIANYYFIQPLIDPDLRKIKYDLHGISSHDLIAYIYVRFAHNLIDFPFQGNRSLNQTSIKKALKLNKILPAYKIKKDYNQNFYLDNQKVSPLPPSTNNKSAEKYLSELLKSKKFIQIINRVYDNNVYNWAKDFSQKNQKFFPFRHGYGLLAIAMTLENLEIK